MNKSTYMNLGQLQSQVRQEIKDRKIPDGPMQRINIATRILKEGK